MNTSLLHINCKLHNIILSVDEKIPLPEDRDMQGFLPLTKSFTNLDFKAEEIEDEKLRQFIRAKRLIDFGTWISNHEVNGSKLIVVKYVCCLLIMCYGN